MRPLYLLEYVITGTSVYNPQTNSQAERCGKRISSRDWCNLPLSHSGECSKHPPTGSTFTASDFK